MAAKGYFVIADITGYTAFLTQSELEEAQSVLNLLFEGLLEAMQPPMLVSNFQGDAILAYVPAGSFIQGQTFLEMLENIYETFVTLLEHMQNNASCDCEACGNMPNLDLKLFVHYGVYLLQSLRGRQELSSPDVILAHRMMKNDVREQTGIKSYALLTEAAVEAMQLGGGRQTMRPYRTTYEHLGEVKMYIHDLRAVYERRREGRRVYIKPEEARLHLEIDLPVPPSLAWDYLTKPEHTQVWRQMEALQRTDPLGGRMDRGTHFHCARSKTDVDYTIVDWSPFDYFTVEGVGVSNLKYWATYQLAPTEQGSRFSWHWRPQPDENLAQVEPLYQAAYQGSIERLRNMIEADLAAGKIFKAPKPATDAPARPSSRQL